MKRLALLLVAAFFVTLLTVSCKKNDSSDQKSYSELIIGTWKTGAPEPYFEVYYSGGAGKQWDTADDVHEDEADTFEWYIDGSSLHKTIHFQETGVVLPKVYDITLLNESKLEYNNDNFKEAVFLTRVY